MSVVLTVGLVRQDYIILIKCTFLVPFMSFQSFYQTLTSISMALSQIGLRSSCYTTHGVSVKWLLWAKKIFWICVALLYPGVPWYEARICDSWTCLLMFVYLSTCIHTSLHGFGAEIKMFVLELEFYRIDGRNIWVPTPAMVVLIAISTYGLGMLASEPLLGKQTSIVVALCALPVILLDVY